MTTSEKPELGECGDYVNFTKALEEVAPGGPDDGWVC